MSGFLSRLLVAGCLVTSTACGVLQSRPPVPSEFWLLPPRDEIAIPASGQQAWRGFGETPVRIFLDSVSLRPGLTRYELRRSSNAAPVTADGKSIGTNSAISRVAVVTSYHGDRYHPETLRALAGDPEATARMASALIRLRDNAPKGPLVIDFQGMTADDLPRVVEIVRVISDSARRNVWGPIGFAVPGSDTVSYPGTTLALVADLLVIRLTEEHRPGTPPGPLASPDWLSRQLALRVMRLGASRVVAELPVRGYRWDRDGTARPISFIDARALIAADAGAFNRDEVSGFLRATSVRDGWEIWIADVTTIQILVARARAAGVTRFALAGVETADPAILDYITAPPGR